MYAWGFRRSSIYYSWFQSFYRDSVHLIFEFSCFKAKRNQNWKLTLLHSTASVAPLTHEQRTFHRIGDQTLLLICSMWTWEPQWWRTGSRKRNGMVKNEPLIGPERRGVSESCGAHHLTPTRSSSPLQTISTDFQNCIKSSLKALSRGGAAGHCVTGVILHLQNDNCKWYH